MNNKTSARVNCGEFRRISIAILEANPLAAEMLKTFLLRDGARKIEHYKSLAEFTSSVKEGAFCAKVIIFDLGSFLQADNAFIRNLRQAVGARIIMVYEQMPLSDLCSFIHKGIHGFLTYNAVPSQLAAAVIALLQGQLWFDPPVLYSYIDFVANLNNKKSIGQFGLTGREAQVLALLEDGLSNKEISTRLRISESTVKFHIAKVFSKLDVRDRRSVMKIALLRERGSAKPALTPPQSEDLHSLFLTRKRAG
jgi:DNA-binding NarL/FixJ family response regulator